PTRSRKLLGAYTLPDTAKHVEKLEERSVRGAVRRGGSLFGREQMGKKLWVHLRTTDFGEAMYVDGKQEFQDDTLIRASEALDVLKEKMGGESYSIDFTYENIDESEKIFSAKTSYNDLFPETIKRENVAESQ
ncbi:MAG: hypothetical protein WC248_06170, partial [Candidatus Methanomethylophilaceae archaeon]